MPHHWPPQASVSQSLWLRAPEQMLPCKRQIHAFLQEGCQLLRRHRIVGTQVPLGCSLAFVQKYTKEDSVSFALYGDGAANQGQLFEALNISALWKMPTILVYRMGTTEWREAKSPLY